MYGSAAGRFRAPELTLAATEADNPEWAPWLRLVGEASAEAPWSVDIGLPVRTAAGAPLLHDAVLSLDAERARSWVASLFGSARDLAGEEQLGSPGDAGANALSLLEAAIAMDGASLDELSAGAGASPGAFATVAQIAAAPVLRACHQGLRAQLPQAWEHGYCPVCGAWPAFAEVIGLERERRVRCGRCASRWRLDVLHCPFCGEREHKRLSGLVVEGQEETMRVDTCRSCGGYIKSLAVLLPTPDDAVAVLDARTVELDLAAVERGCTRPESPALAMRVTVVGRGEGLERIDGDHRWILS